MNKSFIIILVILFLIPIIVFAGGYSLFGSSDEEELPPESDEPPSGAIIIASYEPTLEEKILAAFNNDPIAIAIATAESQLNPAQKSYTDVLSDGRSFSIGLFQINLTVHTLDGVRCLDAFDGKNYNAVIIDEELYNKCVALASDIDINIRNAKRIYQYSGYSAWGAYTSEQYKTYMYENNK